VLPGSGMTHEDLQVVIPLVGLAVDPENDPLFFRIAATQHGSATLSTNGRFVFFTPDAGYIGDASFQIIANDGVSDSAPGTLTVHVSAARLVDLDFVRRNPHLTAGQRFAFQVIGSFADEQNVVLPASYLSFGSTDPQVVHIATDGVADALAG